MRYLFTGFILSLFTQFTSAQYNGDSLCNGTVPIQVYATLKGYPFNSHLTVSRQVLKNGFTVILSDSSYKIVGFNIFWEFDSCPMDSKVIPGNIADPKNLPVLDQFKERSDSYLEFLCIVIEKNGKRFTIPNFFILARE